MDRLLIIGIVLMVFSACNMKKEDKQKESLANTQIDSVQTFIEKAWEQHVLDDIADDAIAAASVFDDEATYIAYGTPALVGRIAIDSGEVNNLKQIKVLELAHTIEGLTVHGVIAYQLGLVKGKFQIKGDSSEVDISARYMASWKKQTDGSWRVHYFVYYP